VANICPIGVLDWMDKFCVMDNYKMKTIVQILEERCIDINDNLINAFKEYSCQEVKHFKDRITVYIGNKLLNNQLDNEELKDIYYTLKNSTTDTINRKL